MPARITIKAELQNLLNKAQALTDANRLSQLEGERRRRAEREQLAAKKVKAEEEERRRRALDDPTMRNIRTAAMGQQGQELAIVIPPGLVFDTSIQGPFAPALGNSGNIFFNLVNTPENYVDGAITGQIRGYSNNLVTSYKINMATTLEPIVGFVPTEIQSSGIWIDAVPSVVADGSYEASQIVTVPRGIGVTLDSGLGSMLALNHVIARGSNIKTLLRNPNGTVWKYYANGDPLAKIPGKTSTRGFTAEAIVFFAAGLAGSGRSVLGMAFYYSSESTMNSSNSGETRLSFSVGDTTLPNVPEFQGVEAFPPGWEPSGSDRHLAYVADADGTRLYVDGQLIGAGPAFSYDGTDPRIWDIAVTLFDSNDFIGLNVQSAYPGKSRLKGFRFTTRPLYTGSSFTPPTSLTGFA